MRQTLLALTLVTVTLSCSRAEPPPKSTVAITPPSDASAALVAPSPPSSSSAEAAPVNPSRAAHIQALVLESHTWNRATRTSLQKLADCRAMSEREDSTHRKGEKFHLYVKGPRELMISYQDGKPLAPGAVIVKRTFVPKVLDGGTVISTVAEDEGTLTAFFVMEKVAGSNPNGGDWLYATTKPDGTVLRAGVLADCMDCHQKRREQGFLYGLDYRYGTQPLR
jgi:hypothetical protein